MKIKDEKTLGLSKQLAKSTTAIIPAADRRARGRGKHAAELAERLLEIGRACAARLKEPFRSTDHGDHLYDDLGLPK